MAFDSEIEPTVFVTEIVGVRAYAESRKPLAGRNGQQTLRRVCVCHMYGAFARTRTSFGHCHEHIIASSQT